MSDRLVRGIVFAHADIAAAMVGAVRQITGCPEHALAALSNRDGSPAVLQDRLNALLTGGPAIVFADLRASSCATVAQLCRRPTDDRQVAVLVGVNLPMLLEFVFHRDQTVEDLVPRLLDCGREGIEALSR